MYRITIYTSNKQTSFDVSTENDANAIIDSIKYGSEPFVDIPLDPGPARLFFTFQRKNINFVAYCKLDKHNVSDSGTEAL